jgi:hypothetical protein
VICIRPAGQIELDRIADFLPRWRKQEDDVCCVAEAVHPARMVGLAVLGLRKLEESRRVADLDFLLFPRFRSTGDLDRLLQPLLEAAASSKISRIQLISPFSEGAPEIERLLAMGFKVRRELVTWEFSNAEFGVRTAHACEKLSRRRAQAGKVEVVGLGPAVWPAVARLVLSEALTNEYDLQIAEKTGLRVHYAPPSCALLIDGEVKGALLSHGVGFCLDVSALVVSAELRRGAAWANALLSDYASKSAISLGFEVVRMTTEPKRHPATTLLGERMGARVTQRLLLFERQY